MTTAYQKVIAQQQKMLDQWLEVNKMMVQPFSNLLGAPPTASEAPGKGNKEKEKPTGAFPLPDFSKFMEQWTVVQEQYVQWWVKTLEQMMGIKSTADQTNLPELFGENLKMWNSWMQWAPSSQFPAWNLEWPKSWMKAWNFEPRDAGLPFAREAWQKSVFSMLENYPAKQYCNMVNQFNEQLERYIEVVDSIDLPLDEMAVFWEKIMDQFSPREDAPVSILGKSMGDYLEMMFYPLAGVVEHPHPLVQFKFWYTIQFYYLSYLIRNLELRGKVLESTMAAWPEAVQACAAEFEKNEATPSLADFSNKFLDKLEEQLYHLMQSEDYIVVQEKIVETMILLKSNMRKFFEVWTKDLPIARQSDLDDIARELEALRVKLRKDGRISKAKIKTEEVSRPN